MKPEDLSKRAAWKASSGPAGYALESEPCLVSIIWNGGQFRHGARDPLKCARHAGRGWGSCSGPKVLWLFPELARRDGLDLRQWDKLARDNSYAKVAYFDQIQLI